VPGRVSVVPFVGLVRALSDPSATTLVFVFASIGLGVAAMVMSREPLLRSLVASHLIVAAFMGDVVWSTFDGFGRVLLPMVAFGILAVAPAVAARTVAASEITVTPDVTNGALLPTEVR
jgi:hypothetical protein